MSLWTKLLILGAILLIVASYAVLGPGGKGTLPKLPPKLPKAWRLATVEVVDFLPSKPATDGSVDYTAAVQGALDAAEGRTLVLPAFPIKVAPPKDGASCLLAGAPLRIAGQPGSVLLTDVPAVQLLRCEAVEGLELSGFVLQGAGGVGQGLGHGLLQITGGRRIRVRDLVVRDADADGIAIAAAEDVRVEGCLVERASKAGIYLSDCRGAVLSGNVVRDLAGHVTASGQTVGAGILLLSDFDLVCANNVLETGIGAGILCNSGAKGLRPRGIVIEGNRVRGWGNPGNPEVSSGIQLANASPDKATHLLVRGNSVQACGAFGIWVENHDGALVSGNSVADSAWSGIVVAHARDALIEGNLILGTNTESLPGQAGIYLHANTSGVRVCGNRVAVCEGYALVEPVPSIHDGAPAGANDLEP